MDSGTELRVIKPEGHLHDVDETRLNLKRLRGLSWSLMGDEVAGDDGGGGGNAGSEGRGTEAGAGGETSQGVTEFDFVSAVFELGLRHASPKIVMMLINAPAGTELTTEHIKSHLQKFRQVTTPFALTHLRLLSRLLYIHLTSDFFFFFFVRIFSPRSTTHGRPRNLSATLTRLCGPSTSGLSKATRPKPCSPNPTTPKFTQSAADMNRQALPCWPMLCTTTRRARRRRVPFSKARLLR